MDRRNTRAPIPPRAWSTAFLSQELGNRDRIGRLAVGGEGAGGVDDDAAVRRLEEAGTGVAARGGLRRLPRGCLDQHGHPSIRRLGKSKVIGELGRQREIGVSEAKGTDRALSIDSAGLGCHVSWRSSRLYRQGELCP